jgi:hypothetical protein
MGADYTSLPKSGYRDSDDNGHSRVSRTKDVVSISIDTVRPSPIRPTGGGSGRRGLFRFEINLLSMH